MHIKSWHAFVQRSLMSSHLSKTWSSFHGHSRKCSVSNCCLSSLNSSSRHLCLLSCSFSSWADTRLRSFHLLVPLMEGLGPDVPLTWPSLCIGLWSRVPYWGSLPPSPFSIYLSPTLGTLQSPSSVVYFIASLLAFVLYVYWFTTISTLEKSIFDRRNFAILS